MPMQPRPSADTSRLLFPSLRFCTLFLLRGSLVGTFTSPTLLLVALSRGVLPVPLGWAEVVRGTLTRPAGRSGIGLARHDLDRRGAGACPDHRAEVRAAFVLRPVGVV